jgi:hypothetical protein
MTIATTSVSSGSLQTADPEPTVRGTGKAPTGPGAAPGPDPALAAGATADGGAAAHTAVTAAVAAVAVPPAGPGGDGGNGGDGPEPEFTELEDWLTEYFLPMFRRTLGGQYRWCRQWWRHGEAISRLNALWHAWEVLRTQPGTGIGTWYREHLDHQLPHLLGARGPFCQCSEETHREPREPAADPAPPGWWDQPGMPSTIGTNTGRGNHVAQDATSGNDTPTTAGGACGPGGQDHEPGEPGDRS